MKGQLFYNHDSKRFTIGDRDLHCGDCFELLLGNNNWIPVRIELAGSGDGSGVWYLVGLSNDIAFDHEGREARM